MKTDCIHYEIYKEARWCRARNSDGKDCEHYLPITAPTPYVCANTVDWYVGLVLEELLPYERLKKIKDKAEFSWSTLGCVIMMTRDLYEYAKARKENN